MQTKWKKCRDTRAGSDAVKAAKTDYLPTLDIHDKKPRLYDGYILRAYFYGAMTRTVEGLAGSILQKSPAVELGTVPTDTGDELLKDVTLTGVPFELLAFDTVDEVMTVGRYGVLVDMAAEGENQRPFASTYRAEDIISWRTERRGGDEVLIRVVLAERVEELDTKDPWVLKSILRYRALELLEEGYSQTIYKEDPGNRGFFTSEEVIFPVRRKQRLDFIPFVFIGPLGVSPVPAIPPLDALADTNLSHYRNSADYEHGLHYTGIPIPWASGVLGPKDGSPLEFGPSHMLQLEKDGRAGIIQADGDMLGALENCLDRKQKLMATLGARLLEEQHRAPEAEKTVGMRHAGEHATLRTVAQAVEQGLTQVLQWLSWWAGTAVAPRDTGAGVELNKDFFGLKMSPQEFHELVLGLQAETISYETFYEKLAEGDVAREGITWEEELKAIARGGGGFGVRNEPPPNLNTEEPPEGDET